MDGLSELELAQSSHEEEIPSGRDETPAEQYVPDPRQHGV